jgi:uncharacterized iron-regulated membrane protein
MRWLFIVLIVSVCALLLASGGLAWHIWRQHRKAPVLEQSGAEVHEESEVESEEAP